ncbi:CotH kinase family protein [Cellulomonas bogoriensis]|uniref:Spore coat protein CotH n=1 Tax=Cellulomonas bogoriensis 69B4 = DSM 16987 TaxID=1386082 RepID=A0A0A0C0A5_9CELL|nr:CotH kinase family protein [Cellulomonas bogoriensis]KGM13367.1 spore coat protein CotH [Cellulomonas bogoriensis 69B4 = DSM 16987]
MPRTTLRRTSPAVLAAAMVLTAGAAQTATAASTVTAPTLPGPLTAVVDTGLAGDIAFSEPAGTFQGQISVTLSTDVPGAQIRYTTDGSPPTAGSPVHDGPIQLSRSTEIRAQAFVGGDPAGAPGSSQYVATDVTTAHDLPVLVLDNYGAGDARDDYMDVAVVELQPGNGTTTLSDEATLATRAGFRLRGNSSRLFDKIPYRLELWDNEDEGTNLPFLGMPADDDWVLRGPFSDKALIRDALVYDLGRELGVAAPRYEFVEVYVNTDAQPVSSSDYQGVYMVVETIKDNSRRLNLDRLREHHTSLPELTGGYIVNFEWQAAEQPLLRCTGSPNCWRDLELRRPNNPQPEQLQWISEHLSEFQQVLDGPRWNDPGEGYPAWIDVDSFVNHMIIDELSRDMDAYVRSAYFHKDRGGKITAGPLWDYDLTFGVGGYFGNQQTSGWQHQQVRQRQPVANNWYPRLVTDPAFENRLKVRWQELRRGELSDARLTARVQELSGPLADAAARNYQRYPTTLRSRMVGPFITTTTPTWQGQVEDLRSWMLERARWLDSAQAWGGPTTPVDPEPQPTPDPEPTPDPTPEPGPTPDPTPEPDPGPSPDPGTGNGCTATFTVTNQWGGGFQGEVQVTATTSPITGWTVTLAMPSGQSVTQVWNADVTSSGSTLTATNLAWNGSLGAGASTSFGLIGSGSGTGAPTVGCTAD